MPFLVTIDGSGVGVGMPPDRLAKVMDQMVIPGVEQLVRWEQEGRIHGGGYNAARGGVFIIDTDSSEEVDQLITSLPHWSLLKVDVKPLVPTSTMLKRAQERRKGLQERLSR
jgi:hypothetical protein